MLENVVDDRGDQGELHDDDEPEEDAKTPLDRLVAEQPHAGVGAEAAASDR